MEFQDLIRTRESVREYDPARPVAEETVARILEAGRIAPTAANRQPFRITVVSSSAALEKVRACYGSEWFRQPPIVLVVVGLRDRAWTRWDGYDALETDCTIVMDHLILAAANEGLGTCWIAAFDEGKLRSALELKENEKVFAITPLGYPAADALPRPKARKPIGELVVRI